MFHKVLSVNDLPDYKLCVHFCEGITKIYDVKPLFTKWKAFEEIHNEEVFSGVYVDTGGYGIVWNERVDLSCDELWENGTEMHTAFDGLMSFADASSIYGLSESTLRKAVSYGKLVKGIDVCKFGKQWLVTKEAMNRMYKKTKDA